MTETVVILADDLIWSTRLSQQAAAVGARTIAVGTADAFARTLATADRAIVDLTARAYDGVAQVAVAAEAGRPVLAVGQHDDADLRRRAIAAGAQHVFAYRRLFEAGPELLARWIGKSATTQPIHAPAEPVS